MSIKTKGTWMSISCEDYPDDCLIVNTFSNDTIVLGAYNSGIDYSKVVTINKKNVPKLIKHLEKLMEDKGNDD